MTHSTYPIPISNLSSSLDQFIGKKVRVYIRPESSFIWEDITESIRPQNPPEPYVEPFRPISSDEMTCIIHSCRRGRIPWTDPLAETSADLINVSFTCNSAGLTQCVILCQHWDCDYLFIGAARLNPVDSFDKLKGRRLSYYRAVTESEAIILPVGIHFV